MFLQADGNEIKQLAAEITDRVTRHELHQSVNSQVKPLVTALSSLEKAIQIQDVSAKHQQAAFVEKTQSLERMYREQIEYRLSHPEHLAASVNREKILAILDEVIRDRRLAEVTSASVETSLAHQTEFLLKQMGILGESIRLEVVTNNREEFNAIHHATTTKITEVTALTKEIRYTTLLAVYIVTAYFTKL